VKTKACVALALCLSCSAGHAQWQWEPGKGWKTPAADTAEPAAVRTTLVIPDPPEGAPPAYSDALARLKTGSNAEAAKGFKDFIDKQPASPFATEAHFWRGVALKRQGKLWEAHKALERYLDIAPGGALTTEALEQEVEIGRAFVEGAKRSLFGLAILSAHDEGIEILRKVTTRDPSGTIARECSLFVADRLFDAWWRRQGNTSRRPRLFWPATTSRLRCTISNRTSPTRPLSI